MRMQLVVINISDHLLRIKANGLDRFQGSDRVLGCLLGQQQGRVVDISNSFEIKYTMGPNGIDIDNAFLVRKQEQCKTCFGEPIEECRWDHACRAILTVQCTCRQADFCKSGHSRLVCHWQVSLKCRDGNTSQGWQLHQTLLACWRASAQAASMWH